MVRVQNDKVCVQNDNTNNVILSETKDLKACTTVHRHGDLEILHCVQNDIVRVQNDRVCVQRNIAPTRKHTTKQ